MRASGHALVNGRLTTVHALSCALSAPGCSDGESQARRIAQAGRGRLECSILPKKADLSRADLSRADLFRLLAAAPRKAAHEAENIAGYAPLVYRHDGIRPARTLKAGLYIVRYIDFRKKYVGYVPSVKCGVPSKAMGGGRRLKHMDSLTGRERQIILTLAAGGLSNRDVGRQLSLSEGTVAHLHNTIGTTICTR
jgi:DNA-binding CsgD family transcriptional regulator